MIGERIVILSAEDAGTIRDFLYSFLDKPCHAALQNCGEPVEVVRVGSLRDHAEKSGRGLLIHAARLPYGQRLRANLARPLRLAREASHCDMVLHLAQFPYERDNQVRKPFEQMQEELKAHLETGDLRLPQYRIVFFADPRRRFGATDTVHEDETLSQLPDQIRQTEQREYPERQFLLPLVDFCTYRSHGDLARVLYPKPRLQKLANAVSRQQFMVWNDWISGDFFHQDLQDEQEIRCMEKEFEILKSNELIFQEVTRNFDGMPRHKPVWQSWTERYYRRCFDTIFRLASLLYTDTGHIAEIRFWKRDADESALRSLLEQRFCQYFSADRIQKNFQCPDVQADYDDNCNTTRLDLTFRDMVSSFVDEQIAACVCDYLAEKRKALAMAFGVNA